MSDTRTPEQVEVDRQLFIAIGKAEELAARRDALRGQPVTAAAYHSALPRSARLAATHGRPSPSPEPAAVGRLPIR